MPDGFRDAVHEKLVADAGKRTCYAAKWLASRLVAHDVDGAAAKRPDVVAALHVADRQTTFDAGRPRPRRVCAGIDRHIAFKRQDATRRIRVRDHLAIDSRGKSRRRPATRSDPESIAPDGAVALQPKRRKPFRFPDRSSAQRTRQYPVQPRAIAVG